MIRLSLTLRVAGVLTLAAALADPSPARAEIHHLRDRDKVNELNRQLAGRVLDFTGNHGCDRRIYSPALDDKRDLYVYLPPGYDGRTQFPGMLMLHGLGHDEQTFLDFVPKIDCAIRAGLFPPVVIASPDGSLRERNSLRLTRTGSFYLNGIHGNFGDYISHDIWSFVKRNFAIRPERDAHVIAGASMGGFGAFNLGIHNREEFGHIAGIMPPINLRYGDCHGRYMRPYDPNCVTLRAIDRRYEVIGKFYGVLLIKSHKLLDPVVGKRYPDPTGFIARENPMEMLTSYNVQPNEFEMFIGYGKKDEFNIAAQVESFVDAAKGRGIRPTVVVIPDGRHSAKTGMAIFPAFSSWLSDRLRPYVPTSPASSDCGSVVPLCAVRRSGVFPYSPVQELLANASPEPAATATLP